MNAKFRTGAGAEVHIYQDGSASNPTVGLTVVLPDPDHAFMVTLTKSEARAIASALMGAAAEL